MLKTSTIHKEYVQAQGIPALIIKLPVHVT